MKRRNAIPYPGWDSPPPTRNHTALARSFDHLELIPKIHTEVRWGSHHNHFIHQCFCVERVCGQDGVKSRHGLCCAMLSVCSSQTVAISYFLGAKRLTKTSHVILKCGPIYHQKYQLVRRRRRGLRNTRVLGGRYPRPRRKLRRKRSEVKAGGWLTCNRC